MTRRISRLPHLHLILVNQSVIDILSIRRNLHFLIHSCSSSWTESSASWRLSFSHFIVASGETGLKDGHRFQDLLDLVCFHCLPGSWVCLGLNNGVVNYKCNLNQRLWSDSKQLHANGDFVLLQLGENKREHGPRADLNPTGVDMSDQQSLIDSRHQWRTTVRSIWVQTCESEGGCRWNPH